MPILPTTPEKPDFNNMLNVQTLLQEYVNGYVKNCNWDTDCPPEYVVSIGSGKLMVTITHNHVSFSEVLFPEKDMTYGVSLLKDRLDSLYARTM